MESGHYFDRRIPCSTGGHFFTVPAAIWQKLDETGQPAPTMCPKCRQAALIAAKTPKTAVKCRCGNDAVPLQISYVNAADEMDYGLVTAERILQHLEANSVNKATASEDGHYLINGHCSLLCINLDVKEEW